MMKPEELQRLISVIQTQAYVDVKESHGALEVSIRIGNESIGRTTFMPDHWQNIVCAGCKHPDHVDGVLCLDRAVGCSKSCPCCMEATIR